MELNSNSIHIGCVTWSGNGSNMSDPSETVLVARLPYLSPKEEKALKQAMLPVIVGMVRQFEKKGDDDD